MKFLDFSTLTREQVYSPDVIAQIMEEPNQLLREQLSFDLLDRAATYGQDIVKRTERMLKLAEKDLRDKEREKQKAKRSDDHDRYTDFGERYPPMRCGVWRADMNGVYNPYAMPDQQLACSHPILPVEIITNIEESTQKVRLAFCRAGRWQEQIVKKSVIANKSKIPELADLGVLANSECAKSLVKYLAEVERLNLDTIPEVRATAKMGWCEDGFMPYTSELAFDRDGRFDSLYDTITSAGSRQKWMDFVLQMRASGRVEPRLAIAASLASVLIKPCGLLPFWVDLWGRSGGGKSICGMLAASVWADPEIGKYIITVDNTISAFEARAGFLNHLPFIIDDTAKVRKKFKDDFSELVYQLANGEGKGRSNTKLGLALKNTWSNIIICSGEAPIITDQLQGGAINRVLEYEVDDGDIFPDGQMAATLLRNNYGFLGREFIKVLTGLGLDRLPELQQECFSAIKNDSYEDKQMRSLSAILTADMIATAYIFKDDNCLTFSEVEKCLTDKNALSENERCYEYILSECAVNENKLTPTSQNGGYVGEVWGKYFRNREGVECVAILTNVFNRICASGGYSAKAFLAWAKKRSIIETDSRGYPSKSVSLCGEKKQKCYVLILPDELIEPTDEEETIEI